MTKPTKKKKVLCRGDRRRIWDGKNAYRNMSAEQRAEFVVWMALYGRGEAK